MKPTRGKLSRETILDAALAIVDAEGLDALSMRKVGEALGVEAMSLYNHVPNKAAMLDGLYERILSTVEPPPAARTWMDHVRHQGRALRAALAAHPNAIPIFTTRPATTRASLARLEENLAVLRADGLPPMAALGIVQTVFAFVVGHSSWSLGPRVDASAPPNYAALDPNDFPNVRAVAARMEHYDVEHEFESGLNALVLGLSQAVPKKRGK